MSKLIKFYQQKTGSHVDWELGSDSICPVDGRLSLASIRALAQKHAKRVNRRYTAWQLLKDWKPITPIEEIREGV